MMQSQKPPPTPTHQAYYDLARWCAGAPETPLIRETWPDLPRARNEATGWLEAHPDVAQTVTRENPEGPSPDAAPLTLLTADHILTTDWPEPVWAIPQILPAGLTNFAGKPKLGKSWMTLQIAQAVAAGGITLGQRVAKGPVLYLALEDSPRRLQDRMKKQHWPPGLSADFMVFRDFTQQIGYLGDEGSERLAQQIEARRYRLVVIDTFSKAFYGDQADVEAMTRTLTPIQDMALTLNCAVVLVDHHRKGFGNSPDVVTDILGSTAKGALADCIWGLYRERQKVGAKLAITGRDVEEKSLALTWNRDTGSWHYDGDADEIELTERRQEILDALAELGKASTKDIANAVGQAQSNTHGRLQDLANADLIKRVQEGRRVFYELP